MAVPLQGLDPNIVVLHDAHFGLSLDGNFYVKEINLNIVRKTLTLVAGPIGSGKSTLLLGMLGEARHTLGDISVRCSPVGYCSQNPWLLNDTVRNNIVAASPVNEVWYKTVAQACALQPDFARFPSGDDSIVGSGGLAISHGQRQRIVSLLCTSPSPRYSQHSCRLLPGPCTPGPSCF